MGFFSLSKKNFSLNSRKKYVTLTIEDKEESKKEESKHIDNNPTGLWVKCPECQEILYKEDLEKNQKKCPKCDYYFRMTARERIELLIDKDSFVEEDANLFSNNPLNFPNYEEKNKKAQEDCGMNEGVISGTGTIKGIEVSIAVMDFNFMGGSMGSVVGEKITRAMERGLERKIPVIVVCTSGGARMHEGLFSLMQMTKTSAAAERLRAAGIPYIAIPVNPTTGGVTASFAMLGDIIVSEPKATIGFAGRRVIEQTIKQKLPDEFQTSEFLLKNGMVDVITKREDMKNTLYTILNNLIG
ncbi:acetyl-CoA carboxylase, carboxyltransferase subunit beta [Fusobacterium sp. SYSU M8D902]|uniref:acetyl-CoA carboxylase, carboxyltransferase subunit beta n=1 Tax=Fusobacterium sp. SYSU M8D902 TaxID=3159562 RepID=UPI0032E39296